MEKSAQVQRMKNIYSLADRVLVYIGDEDHLSSPAMEYIANVDNDDIHDWSYPVSHRQLKSAVRSLFDRRWFSRLWVIQEVARSRSALVICGSVAVSWDCFVRWPYRDTQPLGPGGLPGILRYPSGFTPSSGGDSLLQALHDNSGAEATDPRDKIFGILGLMDDSSPYLGMVDYRSTVEEVYTQAAVLLINQSRSLRLLSAASHSKSNSQSPSQALPSWVPDWRSSKPAVSLTLGTTFVERFNAGGRSSPLLHGGGNVLTVMGVYLTRVNQVSVSTEDFDWTPGEVFVHWREFAGIVPKDGTVWSQGDEQFVLRFERFMSTISARPAPILQTQQSPAAPSSIPPTTDLHWTLSGLEHCTPHQYRHCPWYQRPLPKRALSLMRCRRLSNCEHDVLILGPAAMQPGDVVAVFLGGPTPYVLRPVGDGSRKYMLVGECYVYGVMNGEAFHHLRKEVEIMGCTLPPTRCGPKHVRLRTFDIV